MNREGRHLSKTFLEMRYGQAEKKKLNRKLYQDDLVTCYMAGASSVLAKIIKEHRANPYKEVDELIGEMQEVAVSTMNDFYKKYSTGLNKFKRITLEDMLENQGKGLF